MKTSRKLIYMLATVLTALLPVGCSQSNDNDPDAPDFEEGIPTEVTITLSARSGNATRADLPPDGTPKDPTSSIELIHDWWLLFINKKLEYKIITQNDVADRTTSTSVTIDGGGFEAETFKVVIPSGTYRIYAFANIPVNEEIFKDSKKFKDGQLKNVHLKDFLPNGFTGNVKKDNDGMQWRDDQNIPMTQILKDIVIKNTVEEAFNIEVVRTVAKVEFAFSNRTTETIALKELKFSPISNDPNDISIVPNNDAIGFVANDKLITDEVKTGTLSFDLGSISLTTTNQNHSFTFYCNESLPHDHDKYTKNKDDYKNKIKPLTELYPLPFTIDLTVEKNGSSQTRTFETKDITYINRNDWIHIPIVFNDWKIYWKLHYYPPIGGYPPVFNQNDDGSSLSATLTTGGEFELYPVKIEQNGNSYDLSKIDWQTVEVSVESGSELFSVLPAKIDNPGNNSDHPANTEKIIAGEMKEKVTGDATVKITFKLKDNEASSTLFTCLFTIHRQNSAPSN